MREPGDMNDMDAPATKRDLAELKQELKQDFHQVLQNYPTKDELTDRLSTFARQIVEAMAELRAQLSAELAAHVKAYSEWVATQIGVVDQKYADLPGRVATLERAAVKRTRRSRPRSR